MVASVASYVNYLNLTYSSIPYEMRTAISIKITIKPIDLGSAYYAIANAACEFLY